MVDIVDGFLEQHELVEIDLRHEITRELQREVREQRLDIEAGPGDILVVGPETPHKFKNIGSERLDVTCIHASPRLIQEALEE